jgi:hypothetical protein
MEALKRVSTEALEMAIGKVIAELTGEPHKVSISLIDYGSGGSFTEAADIEMSVRRPGPFEES